MDGNKTQTMEMFLREVPEGQETVLDVVRELTSEGEGNAKLTIHHRTLQPEPPTPPDRAESKARCHVFNSIHGFAEYLISYGGSNTVVFADAIAEKITGVLDEKAEKGRELVTFRPQPHPLIARWLGVLDDPIPIAKLALLILSHKRIVSAPEAKELSLVFRQIHISKSIDIHRGFGADCLNGVVVHTTIQGQENKEPVSLPETITIDVPLYMESEAQKIEIDLTLLENDGKVQALLTSAALEELRVVEFERMLTDLRQILSNNDLHIPISLGRPIYEPWRYLGRE